MNGSQLKCCMLGRCDLSTTGKGGALDVRERWSECMSAG